MPLILILGLVAWNDISFPQYMYRHRYGNKYVKLYRVADYPNKVSSKSDFFPLCNIHLAFIRMLVFMR